MSREFDSNEDEFDDIRTEWKLTITWPDGFSASQILKRKPNMKLVEEIFESETKSVGILFELEELRKEMKNESC